MGLLDRMSRFFKSNANAALDKMSDPAKEVEQLVLDMEAELRKGRGEVVQARATEKRLAARIAPLEADEKRWGERAETALGSGDENLAREALAQQNAVAADLAQARRELAEATTYATALQDRLKQLEVKVQHYKLRKGTIQAKAKQGKRELEPGATDSFEEFERMGDKVEDAETLASVDEALVPSVKDAALAQKIDRLAKGGDVDARLAQLKAKMSDKKDGQ